MNNFSKMLLDIVEMFDVRIYKDVETRIQMHILIPEMPSKMIDIIKKYNLHLLRSSGGLYIFEVDLEAEQWQ